MARRAPGNCQAHLLIGTGAENQQGVRPSFLRSHSEVLLPRRREGRRPGKRPWVPAGFQQPWSGPLPLWAPFRSGGGAVVSMLQGPARPRSECQLTSVLSRQGFRGPAAFLFPVIVSRATYVVAASSTFVPPKEGG